MIKPINRNPLTLQQKAQLATPKDKQVVTDLLDTLKAHSADCVGMAANMIGVNKRIIVCQLAPITVAMINPTISQKQGPYTTDEGCLSLDGERPAKRFKQITVKYLDASFKEHTQTFQDWPAQIIQHEVDHCEGILI